MGPDTTVEALRATVQHYDWGDPEFIARLQGREPTGLPEAELWMGAHPVAPSHVVSDGRTLDVVIAAEPEGMLGAAVAARFGRLPFLAKVLAAARPLSLQAHPSAEQAAAGFAREEAAGVPLAASSRIYRDANHKPELICALTRFEARCGFREVAESRALFASLGPAGRDILGRLEQPGDDRDVLAATVAWLLRLAPADASPLVEAVVAAAGADPIDERFVVELRWSAQLARLYPGDPGLVVALLMNHVVLEPGQALFLGAGNLHAYLRGAVVELMADSDNVVRGGLTSKHVDVEELLAVVDCSPGHPAVQTAAGDVHAFASPVPEFGLERRRVRAPMTVRVDGPEILLMTEGRAEIRVADRVLAPAPGEPVWIPASDGSYELSGDATIFRATVGDLGIGVPG